MLRNHGQAGTVWARTLHDGSVAIAFGNFAATPVTVQVSAATLGLHASCDLQHASVLQADAPWLPLQGDLVTVVVPATDVVLWLVRPSDHQ